MAKALLVGVSQSTFANGEEQNLFGWQNDTTTEVNTQASATEDCTFSNLRININSGGSGTNNLRFRDAGANGNQLATIAGAGIAEDTTNTDSLTAGDLFNLAYTDTGSNSTVSWVTGNISLASGYGCFHGAASWSGTIHDVASATRFLPINGNLSGDGLPAEASVGFKARGYDTFEALQVRVIANARTNTSTFRNRINSGDGTGQIDYAAGATGLVSDTLLADSIADGQIINASLTLDTGVEDLTVSFIGATLKSTTSKQDCWAQVQDGTARAASSTATYYAIGGAIALSTFTEAQCRIRPGFAAVVSNLRCYLSTNTYTVNGTLKLYQNGSPVITTTITLLGGAAWYENTSDTITIDADDELSFEFDEGTTGDITIHSVGITFAPVAGGGPALPPFSYGDLSGIGSSGRFRKDRLN